MTENKKVLVVAVTRDNPVLLQHMFQTFEKYNPGCSCDFLIVDNNSESEQQQRALTFLSKNYKVVTTKNDRVETSFDWAWRQNKGYYAYFFLHDDAAANKNNWLKVFVDRMKGQYVEEIIKHIHLAKLPIGKVGAQTQYWRSYSSILGYSVQCLFLQEVLKIIRPGQIPEIFKYSDCDRVLISGECLEATNGLRNLGEFLALSQGDPNTYNQLCVALNRILRYPDEGIPPRAVYPPGACWNKLCLTAEMMNSIDPLIKGYRTVGLSGDGYLEEIHGYDVMWGHNYVHHYGAPNFREHIAKEFKTDKEEVKKHFNEKPFLMQIDRIVKKNFEGVF
jgi:hypothetical protein